VNVTSDDLAFLSLSHEEMTVWRALPATKAFLEWLAWEQERGRVDIADLVMCNRIDDSRVQAGRIQAIGDILDRMEVPAKLPDPPAEDWQGDPAMRPSLRRNLANR
jgi:hypothetical protein